MEEQKVEKPDLTPELPPKYYLDNFRHLAGFVERMYENILNEEEVGFLKQFRELEEDAQCLFLRMANRRYPVFFQSQLQYEELQITDALWQQLFEAQFAEPLGEQHEAYYPLLLRLLNKEHLIDIAAAQGENRAGLRRASKVGLLSWMENDVSYPDFFTYLKENEMHLIVQLQVRTYSFLLFLYFGNRYMDMSQFVMRDIGNIKLEEFSEGDFTPYFRTRKEADDKWRLSDYAMEFREMREDTAPEEVAAYFSLELPKHHELEEVAHSRLDRLLLKIGLWLEKKKMPKLAYQYYEKTQRPPARERQVRLLLKQQKKQEALALCQHIMETWQNADEKYFALDTLSQGDKKRRVKSTTAYLKRAPSCTISKEYQYRVEKGVLAWYEEQGYEGFHCENMIWRGLFGLVFWQVLFDASHESVHNPFQRMPSDLYRPEFFPKRREKLQEAVQLLEEKDAFQQLTEVYQAKKGIFNPFVPWSDFLLEGIAQYLNYLTPLQLSAVLLEMASNLREHTVGFPDLFVYHPQEKKGVFVEVKSPTDSLAAQQLHWLDFMEDQEIKAQVMRVKWAE